MYSSNYTHVPRYTLDAQRKKKLQRSEGKSCGYYMRIIFFFCSLIQSLIIVSLVLFLVYGKQQDSPSSGRIADLEQSFSRLSLDNQALKLRVKNLTKSLNASATERLQMDQDLDRMRNLSDISYMIIQDYRGRLQTQCLTKQQTMYPVVAGPSMRMPTNQGTQGSDCQSKLEQMKAKERYLQSERNQTLLENSIKVEKLSKDRDDLTLEAIDLRNDKLMLESQIANYKLRCKQDFLASLSGISNVSRAFLEKIDSLFPHHIPFQLTCEKQRENLEQIRSNCTSLSHEVEGKFQHYLNNLGIQVSNSLNDNTRLEASNKRLIREHDSCKQSRFTMGQEQRRLTQSAQARCDENTKKMLTEKKRVTGEKELLDSKMRLKDSEIAHLKDQLTLLNSSCSSRIQYSPGSARVPYVPGSSSAGNQYVNRFLGSTSNTGSIGSRLGTGTTELNKPATNGINGSPNVYTGSMGTDTVKKPVFPSFSVDTGLGRTVLGSTNLGSPNLGNTKPGSGSLGSNGGSIGRSPGGMGSPGNNWLLTTGLGSSSSTTGQGKPAIGSTGSRVQGGLGTELGRLGSSSTGLGGVLGNTGYGTSGLGRATGSAGSYGGLGGGQAGVGSAQVIIAEHLKELERLRRPSSIEKKNESPRTSG